MAYKDFTISDLTLNFGLEERLEELFGDDVAPVTPSSWLQQTLAFTRTLPARSEKAKSEAFVFPLLLELRQRNEEFFNIYSGEQLNIDKQLKGECDFILSRNQHTYALSQPIFTLVEAKKGDIDLGLPQCMAQMYGAWKFNEQHGQPPLPIYGCVTNADEWLFLRFFAPHYGIDTRKYFISDLPLLLGVLQHIITQYKAVS